MEYQDFYKAHYLEIKTTEYYLLSLLDQSIQEDQDFDPKIIKRITSRIKTPESTIAKLKRHGLEPTEEVAITHLSDIIGIRLTVHFLGDIKKIRDMIAGSKKFVIVREKDYIANPKESGYRSYHIIIETTLNDTIINAEIQLRTIAMDCWASLEHQIRYKKQIKPNIVVDDELRICSDDLMSADRRMDEIRRMILNENVE